MSPCTETLPLRPPVTMLCLLGHNMKSKEFLILGWNDFEENVTGSFKNIRLSTNFSDVTLVFEDDSAIVPCHRVVLAAGSTFFQQVLTKTLISHPHPLIYLAGMNRQHIDHILDFLYTGQTKLPHFELPGFLETARSLGIKGLTDEVDTNDVDTNDLIETSLEDIPKEIHAVQKLNKKGNSVIEEKYENLKNGTYNVDEKDVAQSIQENTLKGETDKSVKVEPVKGCVAPMTNQGNISPEKKSLLFGHYFSRLRPDSSICLVCGKKLATHGSNTTGLIRHIKHCHKDQWEEYLERRREREDSRGRIRSQLPSLIWGSYFERVGDGKGKCNTCEYELNTRDGSTTGMLKHMKAKHWQVWLIYSQQMNERKQAKAEEKAKEYVGA